MKRRWAVIIHAKQMKEIPASAGKCADHIWSPVEILSCSLLQENWAMLRLAGANTRFNSSYTLSPSSLSLCVCVCVCVCVSSLSSLPLSLSSPPLPLPYLYLSPPIQQHLLTFPPSATSPLSLTSFRTQLKRITTINICSTCVSASVSVFFFFSQLLANVSLTPVIQPLISLPFTNPLTTYLFICLLGVFFGIPHPTEPCH